MSGFIHLICNIICNGDNLIVIHLMKPVFVCFVNRIYDLLGIKVYLFPISLNHICLNVNTHPDPSLISVILSHNNKHPRFIPFSSGKTTRYSAVYYTTTKSCEMKEEYWKILNSDNSRFSP